MSVVVYFLEDSNHNVLFMTSGIALGSFDHLCFFACCHCVFERSEISECGSQSTASIYHLPLVQHLFLFTLHFN